MKFAPPSNLHPDCTWVKRFDPITLSEKKKQQQQQQQLKQNKTKQKNRAKFGPKLRYSLLLAVESGDTNLSKLEFHFIFATLDRSEISIIDLFMKIANA